MESLRLRKAMRGDKDFLFELRNEEEVRRNSFQNEKIFYEQHELWLIKKLEDTNSNIYILEAADKQVGQVRMDLISESVSGKEWEVSYSIAGSFRGKGYAKAMLHILESQIIERNTILYGRVKQDNIISRKVFKNLGYSEKKTKYGFEYQKQLSVN